VSGQSSSNPPPFYLTDTITPLPFFIFRFDAAPGANAPGAQSGLDALSSLPTVPVQNPSMFSPPSSHSVQPANGSSGGGDLLDLI